MGQPGAITSFSFGGCRLWVVSGQCLCWIRGRDMSVRVPTLPVSPNSGFEAGVAMEVSEESARLAIGDRGDSGVLLKLWKVVQVGDSDWPVPFYAFTVLVDGEKAGGIRLRVGDTDLLRLWAGHIGFNVDMKYRGRRVAERATRLVIPLAIFHGINPVWLTCNPENIASQITLRRLGAVLVDAVDVPEEYAKFEPTATRKQRYRLDLRDAGSD
jgi:predicted acetyltransferase